MEEFVATYPGIVPPPEGTPVGIPAWLGWQHFLNSFFLLLIVRTGYQLRSKQRPPGFWTRDNTRWPRTKRNPRRIGIFLWFHLWLDAFWVLNGIVYVVLLFATGQWLRIVPDRLGGGAERALGGAAVRVARVADRELVGRLQLAAAARLLRDRVHRVADRDPHGPAALVGVAARGARSCAPFPERLARALHYPVMLFFLVFTFVHVVLVLTTGALRKLNQMYAARDADDWIGFAVFAASVVVMAVAWVLAKPPLLKRIAATSGRVQG